MQFTELTEKEYRNFWENHPLKTFLSSPEIGKLRENEGWTKHFVGLKKNNNLVAATMLVSKKRRLSKYEFYSPRGFLMDFNDEKILDTFVKEIKNYVKKKNGYVLRIDPYIINKERDIDGNIVQGGIDNTKIIKKIEKLGFKKVKIENMEQVGWMFSLNLENKTEQEILKEMKPNTRNTIRKAEKIGIEIKELSYDELNQFEDIMIETGTRKNFSIRKLKYFQDMYTLFHDKNEIKYYITQLNLKEYIKNLEKEKKGKIEKLENLSAKKYNEGEKKNLTNEINAIDKRIEDSKKIMKDTNKDIITLSGSMFIMIQPEIIYLSSGNYEEYMKFNSQYLLQWEMIKYGIKNNFKKHNFYGIPANINEKPNDYGIYEFKRGFNGYVEELIGEYELPITWHYNLFKIIHSMRRLKK